MSNVMFSEYIHYCVQCTHYCATFFDCIKSHTHALVLLVQKTRVGSVNLRTCVIFLAHIYPFSVVQLFAIKKSNKRYLWRV